MKRLARGGWASARGVLAPRPPDVLYVSVGGSDFGPRRRGSGLEGHSGGSPGAAHASWRSEGLEPGGLTARRGGDEGHHAASGRGSQTARRRSAEVVALIGAAPPDRVWPEALVSLGWSWRRKEEEEDRGWMDEERRRVRWRAWLIGRRGGGDVVGPRGGVHNSGPLLLAATERLEGATGGGQAPSTPPRGPSYHGSKAAAAVAAAASVGDSASGRRRRMMDWGRRWGQAGGEAASAKKKGRHIIEKMCENARANSMKTPQERDQLISNSDLYYEMSYSVAYSTFETIPAENDGATDSEVASDISCEEGKPVADPAASSGARRETATLLDLYSGCGAMSSELCLGAALSGINLNTKWAVDMNEYACESLKHNHP
ncbi:hypothetical protein ZWY2020_015045 [Hordeum vulgare]|nr:hypothetical protein ZWY2020_015045 [Hordeum vulgare]